MRIAALVPGNLEDQIFLLPTFDALKQAYPSAEIDVVVEPRSREAYTLAKSVRSTIPFDFQGNNSPADWANLLGILRDRSYDIAITLDQSSSAGLLLWLAGVPRRIGFASSSRLFLSNTTPYQPSQYRPAVYHDLLKTLGLDQPCPDLGISLARKDLDWAEAEQKRLGLAGGYVLFYDTAVAGRTYPLEAWQAIAQDFQAKQPALPLVALQAGQNTRWAQTLAQAIPGLTLIAPTTLGQQAACVASANLMLTTPGIPLQWAVALQVYTLALLGADQATELLPQNDKFLGIAAPNGNLAELPPSTVLQKVWGG